MVPMAHRPTVEKMHRKVQAGDWQPEFGWGSWPEEIEWLKGGLRSQRHWRGAEMVFALLSVIGLFLLLAFSLSGVTREQPLFWILVVFSVVLLAGAISWLGACLKSLNGISQDWHKLVEIGQAWERHSVSLAGHY